MWLLASNRCKYTGGARRELEHDIYIMEFKYSLKTCMPNLVYNGIQTTYLEGCNCNGTNRNDKELMELAKLGK